MLVVDTGPLVATADRSDAHHAACQECLKLPKDHYSPSMVIAEAAYLIDRQLGAAAEAALYESILDGSLLIENLGHDDWGRIRELVGTYADLRLGGTDASVITIAERHAVNRIATLNRRHFGVVRPRHIAAFELVPELN